VAGSYVPRLLTGAPSGDTDQYLLWQAGEVQVFYPAKLRVKRDESRIRIRLRNFVFLSWLELDGARAIVSAPAEEPRAENPPLSPFHKGG
jgi:hypothetical protein